jgi:hypothetical protein
VTLELGGKCPLYIDSTVDLKVWQAALYASLLPQILFWP